MEESGLKVLLFFFSFKRVFSQRNKKNLPEQKPPNFTFRLLFFLLHPKLPLGRLKVCCQNWFFFCTFTKSKVVTVIFSVVNCPPCLHKKKVRLCFFNFVKRNKQQRVTTNFICFQNKRIQHGNPSIQRISGLKVKKSFYKSFSDWFVRTQNIEKCWVFLDLQGAEIAE